MPYLSIEGREVYYEIHGQGEPLLLMHHGFGCLKMWKDVAPMLARAGRRVILYDRRGYGRTEEGENYLEFYESDGFRDGQVAEMARVLELLGAGPVDLVGQCEGGVISTDFAAAYPDMVRSLTLGSVQAWSMVEMPAFNADKFKKSFDELPPAMQDRFRDWHGAGRARGFFEMARTRGGAYGTGFFDLRPRLRQVQCPALVIYPDRSALFGVEQGVAMYQALPRGELAVMAMCGHNTYEYRPAEYVRLVLEFQERLGKASALNEAATTGPRLDPNMTCAG